MRTVPTRRPLEAHRPPLRVLLPPLTMATAIVTAGTLLLLAAAITPPPLTTAVDSPPSLSPDDIPLPSKVATANRAGGAVSTTTLVQTAHAELPPSPTVVTLARLTYAPGASGPSPALPGPLLFVIEAGALSVHLDGAAQLVQAGRPVETVLADLVLGTGDSLARPAATTAAFRNDGTVPVVALAAGVFPTAAMPSEPVGFGSPLGHTTSARWVDDGSPGATVQPLVGGWVVDLTAGPAAVALRRVSLPSGASAPLNASGPVALAVETGALTTAAGQGLIWVHHPDGGDDWIAPASAATLLPGDGVLLQTGATATLRNDGSAPLLLLELTVVADGEGVVPSLWSRSPVLDDAVTGCGQCRFPPSDAGDATLPAVAPLVCGRSTPQFGPYTPR